jgi:hypothetical protein
MVNPAPAARQVETGDPPVPGRSSPIEDKPALEKLKASFVSLGIGLGLAAVSWILWHLGFRLYPVIAGAIALFAFAAALSGSTLRARCPFCGASIDSILNREEGRQVRCDRCSEYSTVNAGLLRPLDPATTSDTPKFESPVFRNATWPNACVACGEPPVRFDDLSKTSVGLAPALLGQLQLVRGSVSGIPYCDKHRQQLSLTIGIDKKLYLCWTSLRMMRRYLAANRRRPTY